MRRHTLLHSLHLGFLSANANLCGTLLSSSSTTRLALVSPVVPASARSRSTTPASWGQQPSLPYRPRSCRRHIQNRQRVALRGEKCCSCECCRRKSLPVPPTRR